MADRDLEITGGGGGGSFDLLTLLVFLPSVISPFVTQRKGDGQESRAPRLDPPLILFPSPLLFWDWNTYRRTLIKHKCTFLVINHFWGRPLCFSSSIRAKWHMRPPLISGFCSMKWPGLFLLIRWMGCCSTLGYHPELNSPVPIYTPGWGETLWQKCLGQKARTRTAGFGDERTNHEATLKAGLIFLRLTQCMLTRFTKRIILYSILAM